VSAAPKQAPSAPPTVRCGPESGRVAPVVDVNRCGAKGRCVDVCPFGVFVMGVVDAADRARLDLRGRVKAWVHRGRQARVEHPDACHACGLCVAACPEDAISLRPLDDVRRTGNTSTE
jgi:4Fe-4S ferredoxin